MHLLFYLHIYINIRLPIYIHTNKHIHVHIHLRTVSLTFSPLLYIYIIKRDCLHFIMLKQTTQITMTSVKTPTILCKKEIRTIFSLFIILNG